MTRTVELNWKKKLLLFGILALLVGLVTELGARVIFANKAGPSVLLYGTPWYQPQEQKHPAHTVMFHQNDAGGYRKYFPNEQKRDHNPDTGEEFPVTINSHGFRGEDYSIERTLGTVRIVTLGASSTFGYYDRDDETYPYFLEQRLNQGSRERRYEVINLGMPHLTSWEILALFEAEALQLEPDVVTFYEGANDAAAVDSAVVEEKQAKQESALRKRVRERAARLSLLRAVYRASRDRLILVSLADSLMKSEGVWTYSLADYEKHLAGKVERFLQDISAINDLCKERGVRFVVMKQQAKSEEFDDVKGMTYEHEAKLVRQRLESGEKLPITALAFLTHKTLTDALEEWARSQDVPLVDVIELLDQDRDVLCSWVHLKPRGNAMIADALAQEIRALVH